MLENIDDAGAIVWKEKYQATMDIGVLLKRNVYLKLCMWKNESNNCKYSLRWNYSDCCNVHRNLFIIP
jgi:hypothetical protein